MTKNDYLKQLSRALARVEREERDRSLAYYREMIEDRMEEGLSEEEAVSGLGSVEETAEAVLAEAAASGKMKPERRVFSTLLIVLGFPVWLPLLLAVFAVLLAMYIVAWAIIIVLFAVDVSFAAACLAGVVGGILLFGASPLHGALVCGCGLILGSIAILLFFPALSLSRWLIVGTGRVSRAVIRKIFTKEDNKHE